MQRRTGSLIASYIAQAISRGSGGTVQTALAAAAAAGSGGAAAAASARAAAAALTRRGSPAPAWPFSAPWQWTACASVYGGPERYDAKHRGRPASPDKAAARDETTFGGSSGSGGGSGRVRGEDSRPVSSERAPGTFFSHDGQCNSPLRPQPRGRGGNGSSSSGSGGGGWPELGVTPVLSEWLEKQGFVTATPVQRAVAPKLLAGDSLAFQSPTGSGKTLAYLVPLLAYIIRRNRPRLVEGQKPKAGVWYGLQALVIAPSQELAMQIVRTARSLLPELARPAVQQLIGGANAARQKFSLKTHKPLVGVGTPGRVAKLLEVNALPIEKDALLVFDEADQLVEMDDTKEMLARLASRHGPHPVSKKAAKLSALTTDPSPQEALMLEALATARHLANAARLEKARRTVAFRRAQAIREEARQQGAKFSLKRVQELAWQFREETADEAEAERAAHGPAAAPPARMPHQMVLVGATLQPATVAAFGRWSVSDLPLVRAPGPWSAAGNAADGDTAVSDGGDSGAAAAAAFAMPQRQPPEEGAHMLPNNLVHAYYLLPLARPKPGRSGGDGDDFDSSPDAAAAAAQGHGTLGARVAALPQVLSAQKGTGRRVLVFVGSGERVEEAKQRLVALLGGTGSEWQVLALHGDMPGQARQTALARFAAAGPERRLLLVSDVGARGLDLPTVHAAVSLEPPRGLREYIHRAGRVGRMGAKGLVLSLVTGAEARSLAEMCGRLSVRMGRVGFKTRRMHWIAPPEKPRPLKKRKKRQAAEAGAAARDAAAAVPGDV